MAVQALAQMPAAFTAGDSLSLLIPLADFPASEGWTITYLLALPGSADTPITLGPSTADGQAHALSIPPATTTGWASGLYSWQLRVSKGSGGTLQAFTVGTGVVQIWPTLAAGTDVRTHAEKCLAAISAVIEGRVGDPIAEYRIDNREAKRIPLLELVKLRSVYLAQVRRQRGESPFGIIPVRFESGRFRV